MAVNERPEEVDELLYAGRRLGVPGRDVHGDALPVRRRVRSAPGGRGPPREERVVDGAGGPKQAGGGDVLDRRTSRMRLAGGEEEASDRRQDRSLQAAARSCLLGHLLEVFVRE